MLFLIFRCEQDVFAIDDWIFFVIIFVFIIDNSVVIFIIFALFAKLVLLWILLVLIVDRHVETLLKVFLKEKNVFEVFNLAVVVIKNTHA